MLFRGSCRSQCPGLSYGRFSADLKWPVLVTPEASHSVMAAIGEREGELRAITDKLLEPRHGSLHSTLDELRTIAVSRLTNIRSLIAHPEI